MPSRSLVAGRITASQWVVIMFSVTIAVTLFMGAYRTGVPMLELRFNPYALLSLLAVLSNITAFVMVSRIRTRTDDVMWFSLHIICLAVWAVSEFLVRLSATPEAAVFWSTFGSVGAFMMPAAFYMFALSYTSPEQARHPLTVVPLMLTTFLMMFFDWRTLLLNNYDPRHMDLTPWGYLTQTGAYYAMVVAWIVTLYCIAMAVFLRFYRRSLEPTLKAQSRLFIVATIIPVVGGGITDGILPALHSTAVMPMAVMLTSVMGVIISYGILKYRFFTFNPGMVAMNVLGTMNEAVIGILPNLKIDYANKGAEGMLGYAPAALAKMRFTDLLSEEWSPEILNRALFAPLQGQIHTQFDSVDLRTPDGHQLTVKLSVSKVEESGFVQGYLIVMTDITAIAQSTDIIEQTVEERTREVLETKAKLVTSINSLELGFVITSDEPEVIMVNTAAHALFCHSKEHAPELCHDITLARLQVLTGKHIDMAHHIGVCLKQRKPQELKYVSFSNKDWRIYLSPMVVDDVAIGCAVLFQDTTKEHILERSRDEFFSIASHELRTPLTSIKGNSSMIMQYYKSVLKDPTLKEMVVDIHESSDRLIAIVNDFLDASRLEQGKISFRLQSLPVAKVAEEVIYEMGPILKQQGLYLHLSDNLKTREALPEVIADKDRLKQILYNLVGNAAKFTAKGGIDISAELGRAHITVRVTDTGPGIAPEQQALLFHKFQQAGASILTRDGSKGTGLGLYISRLLAGGMGGELKLDKSELGKGSTFSFTVPVATKARLRALNESASTTDAHTGLTVDKAEAKAGAGV